MGAGHTTYCKDCKIKWYCGYCSYGNSHVYKARSPVKQHEDAGHETGSCTDDFTSTDADGDLVLEGYYGNEKYVIGWANFEEVDVSS